MTREEQEQDPRDSKHNNEPSQDHGDHNNNNNKSDNDDNDVQTFTASQPEQIKRLRLGTREPKESGIIITNNFGCRRRRPGATTDGDRDRHIRSVPTNQPVNLDVRATLHAAVTSSSPSSHPVVVRPKHYRRRVHRRNDDDVTCVLFLVNASGSMSARKRMEAVKGAVLALLADCCDQEKVGVVSFWGVWAKVLLEPTDNFPQVVKRPWNTPLC